MPFLKSLPADAHVPHLFSRYPHIYKLYSMASLGIMRGPSPLSYAQRELIGAFVSALNGCRYCMGSHSKTAEMFGVDPALLEQLLEDVESAAIDDKLKPVFKYIQKLVKTPYKLIEKDAEAVYAAGWDEDALHSMVAVCCTFEFMNHLVMGLGIDPDKQDFDSLGQERFNTAWEPMIPSAIPEETKDVAATLRRAGPAWEYEQEAETIAATNKIFNTKSST